MGNPNSIISIFKKISEQDPIRFESLPGVTLFWTPNKLVKLYSLILSCPNSDPGNFCNIMNMDKGIISRKSNSMDWKRFGKELENICNSSEEECLSKDSDIYRYKTLARLVTNDRKEDIKVLSLYKHIKEMLKDEVVPLKSPIKVDIPISKHKGLGTPEHAVLLLSDSHVGLDFSKEETGGLNVYNIEEFKRRTESLRLAVVDITQLHSRLYPITDLHVLALGDIVHGTNFGGQWGPAYNTINIFRQVSIAGDSICSCLSTWSRIYKNIHFHGVVGNHGRAGMKNTERLSANFDNFVYSQIEGRMKLHKNVKIYNEDSWWGHKNINGTEFAFLHGESNGTLNNLKTEEQKIQSLVSSKIGKLFDVLCVGHTHTFANVETSNGEIFVNGSFVGGDIYSMHDLSKRSRPTQSFFGVHPQNKITWRYNLNLDLKRK